MIDGERGLVLTAAHTVWGARSLKLSTGLGVLHGRIVARAPCDDLAVLEIYPRIPGLSGAADRSGGLDRQPSCCVRSAAATRIAGARAPPLASDPGAHDRRRLPIASGGVSAAATGVPLDSPLVPEVSGGPVVDQAGRLVGMAQAMNAPARRRARPWPCRGSEIRKRLTSSSPVRAASTSAGRTSTGASGARTPTRARCIPATDCADARFNVPVAPTRLPGTEGMDG